MRRTKGFTLIEMLAVLVILVTLAAIVIPRFINAGTRSREAALRQTLAEVRNAISIFRNDTGYYPQQLSDLTATTAPAQGYDKWGQLQRIDPSGLPRSLSGQAAHLPHLQAAAAILSQSPNGCLGCA
jgi:prepilin-type N-terminal cleavage/methylation domain-containing protein